VGLSVIVETPRGSHGPLRLSSHEKEIRCEQDYRRRVKQNL